MDYFFTGKAVCNRCGKEYKWYCVNLRLQERRRKEIAYYQEPEGSHMGYADYCKNDIPIYEGYCSECKQIATLPDDVAAGIPEEFYTLL